MSSLVSLRFWGAAGVAIVTTDVEACITASASNFRQEVNFLYFPYTSDHSQPLHDDHAE
jgi:hypothetical protein